MAVDTQQKRELIENFRINEFDVGSPDVQVAILTARINAVANHTKVHKHDFSGERGLLQMVGQRRRLLRYINRKNPERYRELVSRLGLRG